MIWHVSIKLRTSKGFKGFFKNVVEWVFAFQLFMWYFLVFFHGVFISISKWGQLNQNITSHSVQLQGCWKRLSRRYKKEPHCWDSDSFCFESDSTRQVLLQVFLRFLLHYTLSRCLLQKQVCLQNVVKSKIPPSAIGWTGICSCSINIADEGIKTGSLSVSFSFSQYYGGVIKQYRFL